MTDTSQESLTPDEAFAPVGAVTLFLVDSVTFAVAALLFLGLSIPAAGARASEADGTTGGEGRETSVAADGGADRPAADDESHLDSLLAGFSLVRGTVVSRTMAATVVANASIGGVLAVLPAYGDSVGGEVAYGLAMAAIGGGCSSARWPPARSTTGRTGGCWSRGRRSAPRPGRSRARSGGSRSPSRCSQSRSSPSA